MAKDDFEIHGHGSGTPISGRIRSLLMVAGTRLLDAVLPPLCLGCRKLVDRPGSLCTGCWSGLVFISSPKCEICGTPFETAPPGESICGACHAVPPLWAKARAAVLYDAASRPLILGFKHGDRLHAAPLFIGWLGLAGAEILETADVLVPVPLHPRRLIARRYNQSAVLARGLAARTGHSVSDRALRRVKPTPSQGRMTANQRARNVAGAFDIEPKRTHEIADRHIVLIDDVRTSGATVNACTRVLIRAGARTVYVLTIARVP